MDTDSDQGSEFDPPNTRITRKRNRGRVLTRIGADSDQGTDFNAELAESAEAQSLFVIGYSLFGRPGAAAVPSNRLADARRYFPKTDNENRQL